VIAWFDACRCEGHQCPNISINMDCDACGAGATWDSGTAWQLSEGKTGFHEDSGIVANHGKEKATAEEAEDQNAS
jgi:hypothetical protein